MPDEQTVAFAEIEPVRVITTTVWVCGKCGNDDPRRVRPDATRPSLDPEYAIGTCDDCTKTRKTAKGPQRDRVPLVSVGRWRRDLFTASLAAKADAKLLARFRRGDLLTDEEKDEVRRIIDRLDAR